MSFVIAFAPFMRVALSDDGGAAVEGLVFDPTARTSKVMSDHGILFRPGSDGFSLFYKSRPGASPALRAPITSRTRFSFALKATEPGFFDRYHPDFDATGAQILFDNLDAAGAISTGGTLSAGATVEAADLTTVGPAAYPVRLDLAAGVPPVVEAQDRFSGAVVASTAIDPPPGATEIFVSLDLAGAADASHRLTAPAPSTLDQTIYADDEIADAGALGAVDLYWDQPQDAVPSGTGALFTAVFRRR